MAIKKMENNIVRKLQLGILSLGLFLLSLGKSAYATSAQGFGTAPIASNEPISDLYETILVLPKAVFAILSVPLLVLLLAVGVIYIRLKAKNAYTENHNNSCKSIKSRLVLFILLGLISIYVASSGFDQIYSMQSVTEDLDFLYILIAASLSVAILVVFLRLLWAMGNFLRVKEGKPNNEQKK